MPYSVTRCSKSDSFGMPLTSIPHMSASARKSSFSHGGLLPPRLAARSAAASSLAPRLGAGAHSIPGVDTWTRADRGHVSVKRWVRAGAARCALPLGMWRSVAKLPPVGEPPPEASAARSCTRPRPAPRAPHPRRHYNMSCWSPVQRRFWSRSTLDFLVLLGLTGTYWYFLVHSGLIGVAAASWYLIGVVVT
eukprot:COSAG03_NODE_3354_length_2063_cov_1.766293_2_plen_192_part_00